MMRILHDQEPARGSPVRDGRASSPARAPATISSQTSPAIEDEVAFLSSVNADGTLALYGFGAWNEDTPATYTGGTTYAEKWGANTAGTPGGTISYCYDSTSAWSATEQQWFAAGLSLWAAVCNISFVQTTNSATAQITFTRGSDGGAATATTLIKASGAGVTGGTKLVTLTQADISIDTSVAGFGPINMNSYGGYPIMTLLHEEGHAIGLGHAGPYNGNVDPLTEQFSAYDTLLWTAMSYIDPNETAKYSSEYPVTGTMWGVRNVPTTWMPLDILAIQRIYGTPTTSPLSGGQVFGFNCNISGDVRPFFDFSQNSSPVITLWDMGTGNTLDLSGFSQRATVDLNPGTFSSCGGFTNNICIAYGTAIDTLVCSQVDNTVTCNNNGDTIYGGNGNDTITGGNGNDTIAGRAGNNILNGGGGNNTVSYIGAISGVTINLSLTGAQSTFGGGSDTLSNFQNIRGSNGFDTLTGTDGDNRLDGAGGDDILNGAGGSDTVLYASATSGITVNLALSTSQAIGGDEGNDTLISIENVIGSSYNDTLMGNASNNVLDGGAGNDTVSYQNAGSGVTVSLAAGGVQAVGGGQGSDTLLNIENLIGTAYDDTLTGNSGNNTLDGGAGHNTINGGGGDDTLIDRGSGSTLDGGIGNNTIIVDRSAVSSGTITTLSLTAGATSFLSDGTSVRNFSALNMLTGSGDDTLTFNNIAGETASWDGGAGTNTAIVDMSSYSGSMAWSSTSAWQNNSKVLNFTNVYNFNVTGGSGNDSFTTGWQNTVMDGGSGDDKLSLDYAAFGASPVVFTPGSSTWITLNNGDSFRNFEHLYWVMSAASGASLTFVNPIYDATWGGNLWNAGGGDATATVILDSDTAGMRTNLYYFGSVPEYQVQQYQGGTWVTTVDLYNVSNYRITGGSGDDTFVSGPGTDLFDGGTGYDIVAFTGNLASYTITSNIDGSLTIAGLDGTDTLSNIEELDFLDTHVTFGTSHTGTSGNDAFTGTSGDDTFDLTQGGDDTASGLGGADVFTMGAAFTAADRIDGGTGLDTVQLDGDYAGGLTLGATTMVNVETVVLAAGHSYAITSADATVAAGQTLTVNASALGASNALNFNGAAEADGSFVFIGGSGNDVLRGGAGSDTVDYSGATGSVTVNLATTTAQAVGGGQGSDTLSSIENLTGSAYADTLIGDGNNNILVGGGGADSLRPGMGSDTVSGGNGDDTISFTGGRFDAADAIDGGAGTDLLWLSGDYSGGNAIVMNATTLTNVENIAVAAGFNYRLTTADTTVGAGKALSIDTTSLGASNTLYFDGSAETDGSFTLLTGAGADTLIGGGGGDTFRAGGGYDHVSGNGGNDTISFSLGHLDAADVIDGGSGTDMVWLNSDYTGANAVVMNATTLTNVETIALSSAYSFNLTTADATVGAGKTLTVDGSSLGASKSLTFNGSAETDGSFVVIGGAGADTLTGGAGNDTLSGRAGNDTLNAGFGNDVVSGGDGDDAISFTGGRLNAADMVDGGAGTDTVLLSGDYTGANAVTFNSTTITNVESIGFAAGFSYSLKSSDGTVAAGKTLTIDASTLGSANALTFDGSAETNGTFVFVSGSGADNLKGGSGADTFKYDAASRSSGLNYDTINALNFANDTFDLAGTVTAIDADKTSGSLSTASFDSDMAARMFYLGAHHAILFTPNAGTLAGQTFMVIDCNGTAGYQSGQDMVIRLNGYSGTLTAGAFH